jgi:hypothetical protein
MGHPWLARVGIIVVVLAGCRSTSDGGQRDELLRDPSLDRDNVAVRLGGAKFEVISPAAIHCDSDGAVYVVAVAVGFRNLTSNREEEDWSINLYLRDLPTEDPEAVVSVVGPTHIVAGSARGATRRRSTTRQMATSRLGEIPTSALYCSARTARPLCRSTSEGSPLAARVPR